MSNGTESCSWVMRQPARERACTRVMRDHQAAASSPKFSWRAAGGRGQPRDRRPPPPPGHAAILPPAQLIGEPGLPSRRVNPAAQERRREIGDAGVRQVVARDCGPVLRAVPGCYGLDERTIAASSDRAGARASVISVLPFCRNAARVALADAADALRLPAMTLSVRCLGGAGRASSATSGRSVTCTRGSSRWNSRDRRRSRRVVAAARRSAMMEAAASSAWRNAPCGPEGAQARAPHSSVGAGVEQHCAASGARLSGDASAET
jgi:hypothetical protein